MTYTVRAVRNGEWWALDVPEVPGVFTQVKRLDRAAEVARDAIAFFLEISADSVDVVLEPVLDTKLAAAIADVRAAQAEYEAVRKRLREGMERIARSLVDSMTMRDVGVILGLSHQRVEQLVKGR